MDLQPEPETRFDRFFPRGEAFLVLRVVPFLVALALAKIIWNALHA